MLYVACISASFHFMSEQYSNMWIHHILSIHQLMDGWVLSTFWLLGIMLHAH